VTIHGPPPEGTRFRNNVKPLRTSFVPPTQTLRSLLCLSKFDGVQYIHCGDMSSCRAGAGLKTAAELEVSVFALSCPLSAFFEHPLLGWHLIGVHSSSLPQFPFTAPFCQAALLTPDSSFRNTLPFFVVLSSGVPLFPLEIWVSFPSGSN